MRTLLTITVLFALFGCEDADTGVEVGTDIDTNPDTGTEVDTELECPYDVCDATDLSDSGLLPVYLDEDFTEVELTFIVRSMIDYNFVAGRAVFYAAGTANVNTFTGPEALIIRSNADEGGTLARTYVQGIDYDSIYVYHRSMLSDIDWIHTMKHELVHLGDGSTATNEHTDDSADVMCATYSRGLGVTRYSETDVEIIRNSLTRRFGD